MRFHMFQTSRAHVSFSEEEIVSFFTSRERLFRQIGDYFLHNVYKSDKIMTRQRKRIYLKTMQDKANAYNSKLEKDLISQFDEFLSTLIAQPNLIRQIQAQVKIGPQMKKRKIIIKKKLLS